MRKFILIISASSSLLLLDACNSYPMDNANKSEMERNVQELQKKQEDERNKTEASVLNNFGKPDTK